MKKELSYLLLVIMVIITGCKKKCEYDSYPRIEPCGNNEICVDDIMIIDIMKTAITYTSEYVITNDSIYNAIKIQDSTSDIEWPVVDFEKEILIGKFTKSTGCSLNTSYKLTQTDNEYLLSIRNITHGNCDMLILKTHWLLIPITGNAQVRFNVINNEC